ANLADRLISMDDPAIEPILRQTAVRELARTWATPPYDSVRAIAMTEVARDQFHPSAAADVPMDPALRKKVDNQLLYNDYAISESGRAQYDIRQRELARDGMPELTLYLPVALAERAHPGLAETAVGGTVELPAGRPLEHWTSSREAAYQSLAESGERG